MAIFSTVMLCQNIRRNVSIFYDCKDWVESVVFGAQKSAKCLHNTEKPGAVFTFIEKSYVQFCYVQFVHEASSPRPFHTKKSSAKLHGKNKQILLSELN